MYCDHFPCNRKRICLSRTEYVSEILVFTMLFNHCVYVLSLGHINLRGNINKIGFCFKDISKLQEHTNINYIHDYTCLTTYV